MSRAVTASRAAVPTPVLIVILSLLCPTELSLYVEGLRLPPHRVALIVLFPLAVARILGAPDTRLRSFDALFLMFAGATLAVFGVHADGGREGLVYGGSLALESLGAYFVTRAYVRDLATFAAALRAMFWAIAAAAIIALPETLLGQLFVHDTLARLTGYVHPTGVETRMGLTRAYGTFDHPIHYGTFCAAMLALYCYAEKTASGAQRRAVFLLGATALGLSSAPLLCIALQCTMVLWEISTRKVPSRLTLTLVTLTGLYVGASIFSSRSPIAFIATGMTFDSWTGYYRLQIWEHGMSNVWANPWLGIGLADWERPWWMVSPTVDAFWLVIAMRQGIPSVLLLALAIGLLARAVARRSGRSPDLRMRRLMLGWTMSLVALCLIGCTVHYWNVLYAYFFFFLGLGGALADPRRATATAIRLKEPTADRSQSPRHRPEQRPSYAPERPRYAPEPGFVHPGTPYGRMTGHEALALLKR